MKTKKLKYFIILGAILTIVLLFIALAVQKGRQNIIIDVLSFHAWERRGYRFLLTDTGTLISQYGILQHHFTDYTVTTNMILVLRSSTIHLSEENIQEISILVHRVSTNYPQIIAQLIAFEEQEVDEYSEPERLFGGDNFVLSSRHALLRYDSGIYGSSIQIASLVDLANMLIRLSPLTAR